MTLTCPDIAIFLINSERNYQTFNPILVGKRGFFRTRIAGNALFDPMQEMSNLPYWLFWKQKFGRCTNPSPKKSGPLYHII